MRRGVQHESSATSSSPVADELRAAGFAVRDAGMVEQPFFRVPAHVLVVNDEDLQLYEFASAAEAEQAAAQVGANGMTIGTSSMSWMAPPHFFRRDRTIANYLGSNPKLLAELEKMFGPQFAGQ
jgi:hypothetical protein